MNSRLYIRTGVLALALGAARIQAEDTDALAAENLARSEVVVTATRTSTDSDELAVPVIVITRAEIERSLAGDVAALLVGRSGIEIARTGGPGQPAAVFLSGTDSDHTIVLIDGVRINPGTLGGAAIQNIQPESIERIEIIRGARSSLYGTDAIGGVINIITRAGAGPGASVYGAAGSYGTQVLAADASGMLSARLGAGGSLVHQQSDGFPPRQDANDPGDYANTTANAQLRFSATDALGLRAQLWRTSGNSAYSNYGTAAAENFLDASYAVGADWNGAAGRAARFTLSQITADVSQRGTPDFDHTSRDALDGQYSWRAYQVHELTVGGVATDEHTASLSYGLPYDVRTRTQLAFAQDQLRSGANDLLLALGYTHHDAFGSHITWNFEYGRRLNPGLRATAAFGTAFHAPTSTDRFGYGGNPALLPERSRQGQLGLHWVPAAGHELGLSLFEIHVDDLIALVLIDPVNFVYQAQNVERARMRGGAVDYQWHDRGWQLRANYSLQDPRNLSTGELLLRRARRNALASALYESGRCNASAEVQVAGPRLDYGPVNLGGYTLLSLGGGYQLSPGWMVQMRLDNALDRHYELADGYNTAGRTLTLAMRYRMR